MPPTKTSVRSAASPSNGLLLDHQLCFALYAASLAMTRLYQPLLAKLGLTYPQYLVMLVLWQQDAVSVSHLGERLGLDSGTLTPLLKRMQASGLLARQRDTQDERRVLVQLTPAGLALRERAASIPPCVLQASQCSVPELVDLTQRVHALRGNILQALA
jgi:MarR family transcriptional regulator, organic hydroperoxide resistance regulator